VWREPQLVDESTKRRRPRPGGKILPLVVPEMLTRPRSGRCFSGTVSNLDTTDIAERTGFLSNAGRTVATAFIEMLRIA
jgi:hypothetical protein